MSSIFLSHNHADKQFVRRLAKDLKKLGVRVWIDEAEVKIGDSLIDKLREGIDKMDYLGVVLSSNSISSSWVKKEVDIAMNQEIKGKRVKVLPLLIEDCELPWFLEGKLYADFRQEENYENEFSKLADRLGVDASSLLTKMDLPAAKGVDVPIPNEIIKSVKAGSCVLFLGSMASAPAPVGSRFHYQQAPPGDQELSRRLAARCRYPDEDITNLQRVSLYFQSQKGGSRKFLTQAILNKITGNDIVPSPILYMLAALPFRIIVTTNYDHLFEVALNKSYTLDGILKQPIVRIYEPNPLTPTEDLLDDPSEEAPLLFKLFGDVYIPK